MNYTWSKRGLIVERDGLICRYCGDDLTGRRYEIDHIIPKSRGGSHKVDNLGVACRPCNGFKGMLLEEEFLAKAERKLLAAMAEMEYWGSIVKNLGGNPMA